MNIFKASLTILKTHNSQTNQVSTPIQSQPQPSSQSEKVSAAAESVEEADNKPTTSEESQKSIEERVTL